MLKTTGIVFLLLAVPAFAHGIYTGWQDPKTGLLCCNNTDCAPYPAASVRPTYQSGVFGYALATGEFIPATRTIPSPDAEYHRCIYAWPVKNPDLGIDAKVGDTRCFAAPIGAF